MEKAKIDEQLKQKLVEAGVNARKRAYAPYSKYFVGAAVLTEDGKKIGRASCRERV